MEFVQEEITVLGIPGQACLQLDTLEQGLDLGMTSTEYQSRSPERRDEDRGHRRRAACEALIVDPTGYSLLTLLCARSESRWAD